MFCMDLEDQFLALLASNGAEYEMVVSAGYADEKVRIALGLTRPTENLVFVPSQVSIRAPMTAGTSMHAGCVERGMRSVLVSDPP